MNVNRTDIVYESMAKSPRLIAANDQFTKPVEHSGSNGAIRLTTSFLELLEKQFPIASVRKKMNCRFPGDFAEALFIHVNHLNRSLKDITGKTTSQLIAERMIKEACMLLNNTEWNIGEIGWCLGFEEVPHFINFFKKNLNITPKTYRKITKSKNRNLLRIL